MRGAPGRARQAAPAPAQPSPLLQFAIGAGYPVELVSKALARFSRSLGVAQAGVDSAFEVLAPPGGGAARRRAARAARRRRARAARGDACSACGRAPARVAALRAAAAAATAAAAAQHARRRAAARAAPQFIDYIETLIAARELDDAAPQHAGRDGGKSTGADAPQPQQQAQQPKPRCRLLKGGDQGGGGAGAAAALQPQPSTGAGDDALVEDPGLSQEVARAVQGQQQVGGRGPGLFPPVG
jgi:hypothetical protein